MKIACGGTCCVSRRRVPAECPRAGGRHLDAYDSHHAQYWPAVQYFVSTLQPAQQLPPLPAGEPALQAPEQQRAPQREAAPAAAAAALKEE